MDALKRSAKACNRCRKRRTKCLGDPPYPCMTCADAGHACVYSESEKRVNVPESYLIELQAQARKAGAGAGAGTSGSDSRDSNSASSDAEAFGQDIELGFSGTDNWVLSGSGQYRRLHALPGSDTPLTSRRRLHGQFVIDVHCQ